MTVHANAFYGQIETGRRSAPLQMRETSWGYIVAEKTSGSDDGHHAEAILRVLAVFMLFSSILPWVYFGGDLANNTIAAKLALSSGFFVIGVAAYLHAGRGFKNEIQIDSERREFRLATRNSRNIASVRRTIKMNNIDSCFLKRSTRRHATSQMFLRLRGRAQPIAIAAGSERELRPMLERIAYVVRH
ncbi:MAG: hypothetical protein GKR98_17335 [Boseongicola sp.]|nr:MAG: hypothetical protein GKR98_17335 [Boseongicola sp.]